MSKFGENMTLPSSGFMNVELAQNLQPTYFKSEDECSMFN
jgi:hypothetical protein